MFIYEHIEEVRKLMEQRDDSDILNKIIMNSSEGQNIELQNTSISIIYLSNPIYFILPSNNSEEGILVEVEHNLLAELIGQDKLDILLEKFNEKLNSVLIFQSPFLSEITIRGGITKIKDPITLEKDINVIRANHLARSMSTDWKRGYLLFEGEDKSYLQINEGLRERIAKGLQSYVHTNIFGFLTQEVYNQFIGNKEKFYAIIECEKCKEIEIYHAFEIANRLFDSRYCRKCSKARFKNLMEVPFSDTFLIDIFTDFNIFFEKYAHKNIVPPDRLIEKLLRYSKLDHQLEIGVVYDYLRNRYKERFQKSKYDIMIKLEDIVRQAEKNSARFQEFLQYDEKFSTIQSFQTTSDISMIYNNIFNKDNNKLLEFYYPNPITRIESNEFIDISEVDDVDFNSIINLYKDTFDLIGDHWFLSNLAKVIKNAPIIEDCITADLYGENLLNKTLRYTKKTDLYDIIKEIYNVKIRNAIAHPGRVIDKANNEIRIYDKGELLETYKINDFLLNVEKLIDFHLELTYVKYRLAMKKDIDFLKTGGILSFQPEFYTKPGENEKPHLVINQLAQFKDYNKNLDFWPNNIKVEKVEDAEAVRFSIKRSKSNYFETPEVRESVWGLSGHIKEWLEMALKEEEIIVTHRYCYIPIDISSGEKDLQWIPIKIPIYPLEEEQEVFIKSMSECGKIALTDSLRNQFLSLI